MRWPALLTLMALISAGIAVSQSAGIPQTSPAQRATLEKYCITCHSQSAKDRGMVPVALDMLDLSRVGQAGSETEIWEKVVRKMNAGVMPPPGSPRPERTASEGLISFLTTQLDRAADKDEADRDGVVTDLLSYSAGRCSLDRRQSSALQLAVLQQPRTTYQGRRRSHAPRWHCGV